MVLTLYGQQIVIWFSAPIVKGFYFSFCMELPTCIPDSFVPEVAAC